MWSDYFCAYFISYIDYTKMNELEKQVNHIESELQVHAVQCEERWKTIFTRIESVEETLERMEGRIMVASGTIIIFLLGLIAAQVM